MQKQAKVGPKVCTLSSLFPAEGKGSHEAVYTMYPFKTWSRLKAV